MHLRAEHRDVVVEGRVRPDDRVHLADRAAGVGLHQVDVGVLAVAAGADDERRGTVAEDHPGRPDGADLVGELLPADEQHRAIDLLQQPGRLGEPVRQAGAGRDDVGRHVRLEHPELPGEPGRDRRHRPALVQEQNRTAPISSALPARLLSAAAAASSAISSRPRAV